MTRIDTYQATGGAVNFADAILTWAREDLGDVKLTLQQLAKLEARLAGNGSRARSPTPTKTPPAPRQTRGGKGCSIPDCIKPHAAKGWCKTHWQRNKDGKPMDAPIQVKAKPGQTSPPASNGSDIPVSRRAIIEERIKAAKAKRLAKRAAVPV